MNGDAPRYQDRELAATGRRGLQPGRRAAIRARRIVVGVDGSGGSVAALRWAAAEACRRRAPLRIVSVWEEPDRPEGAFDCPGDGRQIAAARVQRALGRVLDGRHQPEQISCAVPEGHPGKALVAQAEGAELLILGLAGTGTERAPGPVGLYCLRHAQGPVIFVPGSE